MDITTFAKSTVINLLKEHDCVKFESKVKGKEVWVYDKYVIIQLPGNNSRIDYEEFEMIAREQLDMSIWEFDLWVGKNSQ